MSRRRTGPQAAGPICFAIAPRVGRRCEATDVHVDLSVASRDELAKSELEAAQTWEAFIEIRSKLASCERDLDDVMRANDQFVNRIRRLRGRVVEQHHESRRMGALLAASNTAADSAEQNRGIAVYALTSVRRERDELAAENRRLRAEAIATVSEGHDIGTAGSEDLKPSHTAETGDAAELRTRVANAERRTVAALQLVHSTPDGNRVRSVAAAIAAAQQHLPTLSIPQAVAENARSTLDQSGRRAARGKAVMRVLLAFHAYALDAHREGDFKHWCERRGHEYACSANRVAMGESESVTNGERFRRSRQLPVDRVLDPSGARLMPAHVKIDQGPTAPRLHFLDDTRGETGKIHIGYIGPHLPTATDPT
ncbi:hypothetical protein [Candidatus Poriferisodalis sp.]|uniref:hypothetical protein n=1 Tax=Candidatus Poriferisodalis sp. TaxID=3101277 RepID=UPI003B52F6F9